MRKAFKFPLEVNGEQTIQVPYLTTGTLFIDQVLSVDAQYGVPCIWAMVDSEAKTRPVKIIIHGTGHDADDTINLAHIGSFMLMNGDFVGHVFSEILV